VSADRPRARSGVLAFALSAALCLGLLLAAYANFFGNAFHFDDFHVLEQNLYIRSLANVPRFFLDAHTLSSLPSNSVYRPLVSLSLALDYSIAGGLDPGAFHVTQLGLLLILAAGLVGLYWRVMDACQPGRWNRYLALVAATLFAVHTANTETLNLMHVRSEIVSALGIVAAFLIYLGHPSLRRLLVYLLPMAIGALAKIPAVLFGPLLFAWVLLRSRGNGGARDWTAELRQAAVAAAPALVTGGLLFLFVESMAVPGATYGGGDRLDYARTQLWVWVVYLRMFLLPVGLTADTDLALITTWTDPRLLMGGLVLGALAAMGWRAARSERAWPVAFGLSWFAIGLTPTSSVIPLAEPMNEHRVFLPYIGLCLALVWAARIALEAGFTRYRLRPAVRTAVSVGLCGLLLEAHVLGTHVRNQVWRTHEGLWADVTRKSPRNGRAWMNYGLPLMARGQYHQAKAAFLRALELAPNYSLVEINLGIVSAAMGDHVAAERHFRRALTLTPMGSEGHYYLARWLVERGRAPEAMAHVREATRLSPVSGPPRILLMDLLAARGDAAGAAAHAREYLAIDGANVRVRAYVNGATPIQVERSTYSNYFRRGLDLGAQGRYVESALAYRAALTLEPQSVHALNNLGWTLGTLGFLEDAALSLDEAVRLRPDFTSAHDNLAWVKGQTRAGTPPRAGNGGRRLAG
jgi:tetratricopeptide (TPR) repeat protein